MCRLLGIVASRPVDFRTLLSERPRSLAALGEEHRDGWGLAAFSGGKWRVHKGTRPASCDARFRQRAEVLHGDVLVSHVRKRTVGATCAKNSHPFSSGRWVFAHNGTIEDRAWIASRTSSRRSAEILGDTDSEAFFAFLLTRLDEADHVDSVLERTLAECRARPSFGSFNFLLSDGETFYAHRFGRSLFVLERGSEPDSRRAHTVFVASEAMTDEPWRELPSATLLRVSVAGARIRTAPS